MIDSKYNLITAIKARNLLENKYPENLYLLYMKDINDKIKKSSERLGENSIKVTAPSYIIKDKVYRELKEAGYIIEEKTNIFRTLITIIRW